MSGTESSPQILKAHKHPQRHYYKYLITNEKYCNYYYDSIIVDI